MKNRFIENFEKSQLKDPTTIPEFKAGDTLSISVKIVEGTKSRVQKFEGVCISRDGEGTGESFTIRKIGANNIGVERTFPLHSKSIEEISLLRRGIVRRAKLYYLRERKGKSARIKEKRDKR